MDIQETIDKLDKLQAVSDEAKKKKNRLEGESEANDKRLKELEERSLKEIGVPSSELPKLLEEYEQKIKKYTEEIDVILNGVKQ